MATISNTPRPGYVWDATDNVWYPIGVGAHQHTNAADTPAVMPYSTYAAAGKNKIINGDFNVNQRGFTTSTAGGQYVADRFVSDNDSANGTVTKTLSAFTPGTAPVSGYEATNYFSIQTTGQSGAQTYSYIFQNVEDVRTFAGQTVTFSFWAKAASGTPKISLENRQSFGSGGSSQVNTNLGFVTLSTSWVRYSVTGTVPSVSGKTIGAGSFSRFTAWVSAGTDYSARTNSIGIQSNTFDIWGVQVEAGSNVTAFQTATGNPASELAACQRYFYRTTFNKHQTWARDTNIIFFQIKNPVYMRGNPSVSTTLTSKVATTPTTSAQVAFYYGSNIAGTATLTMGTDSATTDEVSVYFTGATFTQGVIPTAEFAGGYFDISAEL
jgi:hypothetical protein